MAPEVILGHPYTQKADIWSLGCVFYQLLTGFMPFDGADKQELKTKLNDGTWYIPSKVKLSDDCIDFLDSCLKFDENERIDWAQLKQHNYLSCDLNFAQYTKQTSDGFVLNSKQPKLIDNESIR